MIVRIFPSTVAVYDLPDPAIAIECLAVVAELRTDRGIVRSNTNGGWHSRLFGPGRFPALEAALVDALRPYTEETGVPSSPAPAKLWAITSPKGAGNRKHTHRGASVAGVFYACAPEGSSPIVFVSPSGRDRHVVEARTGRLVLFPGWLEHEVAPNPVDAERVVVSFNYR